MCRHGQSEYNRNGRIGGDSGLSEHGVAYARALAAFVKEKVGKGSPEHEYVHATCYTSSLACHSSVKYMNAFNYIIFNTLYVYCILSWRIIMWSFYMADRSGRARPRAARAGAPVDLHPEAHH